MPEETLSSRTYTQLVGEFRRLSHMIDAFRDMTPEEERAFRRSSGDEHPPPEDFRSLIIIEAGLRQVEIVRECLRRVDLGTLAGDTGYPEESLMLLASYRGDPPDPTAN